MNSSKRSNILFIMTDQFRADCIGALGNGRIKTPHIDRLVREGTAFTKCYTPSPVCMPARHSLTSGMAPHLTGCVDNVDANQVSKSFMDCLVEQGYQTHGTGKMHFSHKVGDWGFSSRDTSEEVKDIVAEDDYKEFLVEQGFGHVWDPHGLRSELYYLPQPSQLPEKLHHSHWVADRSIDFLKNRDRSKPFLLWSSFIKPHPPFESPNPWGRLYRMHEMEPPFLPDNKEDCWSFWNKVQNRYKYVEGVAENRNLSRSIKAAYYGTISFIDYNIGRILDELGSEIDNTLIVFTSDHGELLGDFGCYGKRCMLEPSVRVPMIARFPGIFPENYRCSNPATLLDLYPTFTSIAGVPAGQLVKEGIRLNDVMEHPAGDRIVFSQFSQNQLGLYMAVDNDFKYIFSAADDKEWLFDLVNDPLETINKINDPKCQGRLERLKEAFIHRFQKDGYTLPIEGDGWKRFPAPPAPLPNTDEGLLFQDPQELCPAIKSLGNFTRPMEFVKDGKFKLLENLLELSKSE